MLSKTGGETGALRCLPNQQELVDVNEIAQEILFLLRSEPMQYSISVRTELASDLPRVIGDRAHLQQVLMNLIMNSIDAMKDANGTRELCLKSQRNGNRSAADLGD